MRTSLATLIAPIVVIAVSLPLIAGWIGRNYFYGFRTPRTLSSDAVWYPANRVGGLLFVCAGLAWLATGLAAPRFALAVGLAALALAMIIWIVYVRRLPF